MFLYGAEHTKVTVPVVVNRKGGVGGRGGGRRVHMQKSQCVSIELILHVRVN